MNYLHEQIEHFLGVPDRGTHGKLSLNLVLNPVTVVSSEQESGVGVGVTTRHQYLGLYYC